MTEASGQGPYVGALAAVEPFDGWYLAMAASAAWETALAALEVPVEDSAI